MHMAWGGVADHDIRIASSDLLCYVFLASVTVTSTRFLTPRKTASSADATSLESLLAASLTREDVWRTRVSLLESKTMAWEQLMERKEKKEMAWGMMLQLKENTIKRVS